MKTFRVIGICVIIAGVLLLATLHVVPSLSRLPFFNGLLLFSLLLVIGGTVGYTWSRKSESRY